MAYEDTGLFSDARDTVGGGIRTLLGNPNATESNDNIFGKIGRLIQPEEMIRDGKRFKTNTRITNERTPEQLQEFLGANLVPSDDKSDRHFYILENTVTGEKKFGTSKEEVEQRYKNEPDFFTNWKVHYDQPLKNAEQVENILHGNIGMQKDRTYDQGDKIGKLFSGYTEVYNAKNAIFNDASESVKALLDPEQKELFKNISQKISGIEEQFGKDFYKDKAIEEKKTILNEEELILDENFARKSKRVLNALGVETDNMTWKEVSEEAVRVASDFNWNLVSMGKRAYDVSNMEKEDAKAFQEVMDLYEQTDVNLNQVLRGLKGTLTDPTILAGAGTFGIGTQLAKQGVKQLIKQSMLVGAGEGAVYSAIDNSLRQSVAQDSGKQDDFDLAQFGLATGIGAGAGAVLGGTIQGLITAYTNRDLGGEIVDSLVNKIKNYGKEPPEVQEKIIKSLNGEELSYLREHVKNAQNRNKDVIETTQKKIAPKKEGITVEVKPEDKASTTSKTGAKISDSEGMEKLSEVEFDVVKPTKEASETVTEFPIRKDVKTEERQARAYYEEGSLLSPSGDISQKATLKIRQPKEITDVKKYVDSKLEIFDREAKVRKSYGKAEASLKDTPIKSSAQVKANRLAYERDLYESIWKDQKVGTKLRREAGSKFNELKDKVVKEFKPSKESLDKAKAIQEKQIGKAIENKSERLDRETELSQQFEHFKKVDKDYKEGFGFADKQIPDAEILKNIIDIGKKNKSKFAEAKQKVSKAKSLGTKPNPDHEYIIRQQQELASDLDSFRNKKIDIDELRYREMLRLEDRIKKDSKTEFEGELDMLGSEIERLEQYSKLGIKKKKRDPKWKKKSSGKDYVYKKENDNERLTAESKARSYQAGKPVGRKKTGEATFRKDETEKLDQGIDPELFGRMSSSNKDIKAKAKEEWAEQINKLERESMGITDNATVKKEYQFKDEMTDASNSAYQFISVLMGDKSLAKGTKIMFGGKDFRQALADRMVIDETIKAKIEKNTGEEFGKEHIKPLAMVWAYGSSDRGLIKTFAKDNGLTLKEAEHVFQQFNKEFMNMYPSAKVLRDSIYALQGLKGGKFEWTLPNGTKSGYTAKGTIKGTLGKQDIELATDTADMNSRALMPNIIHSIDGYAIQEVAKRLDIPVATVHDAVRTPSGESDKVLKVYTDIMQEINDSNLLDDIMKELGYKGPPIKKMFGDLSKEDIATGTKKMSPEHMEGDKIPVSKRELDDSKVKEPIELMNDYMASMDVRTHSSNRLLDAMVNEQMYSRTIDAPSDSPFENVIFHAMNGNRFTEKMAVKAPDGVSRPLFIQAQRKLFEQARAKLEYNPLVREKVKGQRKYFDENGRAIGDKSQTVQEILRAERNLAKSKNIKTFEKTKKKVQSWKWNKVLTKKEYIEKKMVNDVIENVNKLSYKTAWNIQNSEEAIYKKMRELQSIKDSTKANIDRNAELLHKRLKSIDDKVMKDIEVLAKSDYEPIMGITPKQVTTLRKEATKLPKGIDAHIDASARGIGKESEQFGYYANNGQEIANRFKLDREAGKLIDQLISVRAMDLNGGWARIEKLKDNKDLDFVMKAIRRKRLLSEKELFYTNPENVIKGYQEEIYKGQKELSPEGKVQYRAGAQYEEGLLGKELEDKKIGTVYDEQPPVFQDKKAEFDWMKANRLRKTKGQYRKVADEKIRKELGKSYDFREALTETMRSTEQKVQSKELTMYTMIEADKTDSLLFSKEAKDGFVKLNETQLNHLPYDMRQSVKYVNKEMFEPIMGREEVRLYNGTIRGLQIIDRLANNFASQFKQNNVLKNPTSYINSFIVNQTLGLGMGINPAKHAMFQKEGLTHLKEMNELTKKLYLQKVTGEKPDRALQKKLSENPLYQMEQKGLSTNRVEGVLGDEDLLGSMLKDTMNPIIYNIAKTLNLSQKTKMGEQTIHVFSLIDTTGRYAMVKSLMAKNTKMTLKEAINESNGLYSNMDEMAPAMIELLDKYPLAPFLKWFSKTTPKLLQVTKNNPIKSIVTAIGLYILAQETNRNLSTTNPLEAMIDFAEGSTPFATYDKIEATGIGDTLMNSTRAHIVPKYLVNIWKSPETMGADKLLKKRIEFDPYKGFVQDTIEGE